MSLSLDRLEQRERKRKTPSRPKPSETLRQPKLRPQPWSQPTSTRPIAAGEGLSSLDYNIETQWWPAWAPSNLESWSEQWALVSHALFDQGRGLSQKGLFHWQQIKTLSGLPQQIITDIAIGSVRRALVWQRKKAK